MAIILSGLVLILLVLIILAGTIRSKFKDIYNPELNYNVIGGAEIYKEFLPYCKLAFITKAYKDFHADTFLPFDLNDYPGWTLNYESTLRKVKLDEEYVEYRYYTFFNTKSLPIQ